jgi:threonine/homoserine/homoserine lactone efflux protein
LNYWRAILIVVGIALFCIGFFIALAAESQVFKGNTSQFFQETLELLVGCVIGGFGLVLIILGFRS